MADRHADASQREDDERHQVERIMRVAETLGHDPGRVERALDYSPLAAVTLQPTVEVKRGPAVSRFLSRAFARRP